MKTLRYIIFAVFLFAFVVAVRSDRPRQVTAHVYDGNYYDPYDRSNNQEAGARYEERGRRRANQQRTTSTSTSTTSPYFSSTDGFSNDLAKTLELVLRAIESAFASFERLLRNDPTKLLSGLADSIVQAFGNNSKAQFSDIHTFFHKPGVATALAVLIETSLIRNGYQTAVIAYELLKYLYSKTWWMVYDPFRAKDVLWNIASNGLTLVYSIIKGLQKSDPQAVASAIFKFYSDSQDSLDAVGLGFSKTGQLLSVLGIIFRTIMIKRGYYKQVLGYQLMKYVMDYISPNFSQ